MRALALLLIVAIPTAALAKEKRLLESPSYEQPVAQRLLPAGESAVTSQVPRWYFWVGLSAAAIVAGLILGAVFAATAPRGAALTKADFPCGASCSGFINAPAM